MADIDSLVKKGIFSTAGSALCGLTGQLFVPTAFAISAGTVAAACAVGTGILVLPYLLLQAGLDSVVSEKNNPLTHWILSTAISVGQAVSAAVIGATILGVAAAPIAYCALTGMAVLTFAAFCFTVLIGIATACTVGSSIADTAPSANLR